MLRTTHTTLSIRENREKVWSIDEKDHSHRLPVIGSIYITYILQIETANGEEMEILDLCFHDFPSYRGLTRTLQHDDTFRVQAESDEENDWRRRD